MKKAIEVLLDAFENSMCKDANQKSRSQYRSVINALGKDEVFKTDAEKNFLTLVIKLIANNREDECIKLIGLLRYSVCVYNWGSLRSYETYCNKFTDFLEKLLSSEAASKKSIKKKIASACTTPTLSDTEESWLKTAFAKRTVFLHEQLMTIEFERPSLTCWAGEINATMLIGCTSLEKIIVPKNKYNNYPDFNIQGFVSAQFETRDFNSLITPKE